MINRGPRAPAFWAVTQGSLFSKQSTTNIMNKSNEWLWGSGQLCFPQFHTAWGNEGYKIQEKTRQKHSSLPPSSGQSSGNWEDEIRGRSQTRGEECPYRGELEIAVCAWRLRRRKWNLHKGYEIFATQNTWRNWHKEWITEFSQRLRTLEDKTTKVKFRVQVTSTTAP